MKTAINGPKHKKQEPMAINDPVTKELLVNEDAIKSASLLHNIKMKQIKQQSLTQLVREVWVQPWFLP